MNEQAPHAAGKKTCGAKTRQLNPDGTAKLCQRPGTGAGGRCRLHGGNSLIGSEAGRFKHGRRSKYLVGQPLERFQEAMADKSLMHIRQDVALVETLITAATLKLPKDGRPPTKDQEERLLALVDQRRRLIESEARRMQQLQQMITVAQFTTAMKAVAEVIREFVTDDGKRRMAQRRLEQLLLPSVKEQVADDAGAA